MVPLLIALVVLGLFSALLGWWSSRKNGGGAEEVVRTAATCSTCTGSDDKCEQECMMEAATREIEYYDDEELDRFAGRDADDYTDEEVGEFSDVLYTMRPDEVKGWWRSLTLRGIALPNALKDEVIGFVS